MSKSDTKNRMPTALGFNKIICFLIQGSTGFYPVSVWDFSVPLS